MHSNSKTLIFINILSSTFHFPPYALNCRGAHTAVELLLPSTTLDSDLQTESNFAFTNPYIKAIIQKMSSNPRSLLYLYIPMVCRPWASRHILDYSITI